MYRPRCTESSVKKNKRFQATAKSKEERSKEKKRREKKEGGGEKMGVKGGAPLCAAGTNFPKERIKRLAMKGKTKRKRKKKWGSRECSQSCQLSYSRSQIVIHAELEHLILQFEIIPFDDASVHTNWSDYLKLSTHTNCQKVALARTPWQNIRLLYEFH